MLRKVLGSLVLVGTAVSASSAFAFFDVEVLAGKRWYELDTTPKGKVSSQEVDVAAHISPIPLVPVSFGAKVALGNLDKDAVGGSSVDTASVFEAGLDVMAWVPMIPFFTPFARVNLPVTGTWAVKGKSTYVDPTTGASVSGDYAATAKISGLNVGLGLKYEPLPLIKILLEVERGMETYKLDTVKSGGVTLTADTKSYSLSSNGVLLGIEIGL